MTDRDPETVRRVLKELDDIANEAARLEQALDQARQTEPILGVPERRVGARRRSTGRRREDHRME